MASNIPAKRLKNSILTAKYRALEFKSDGFITIDDQTVYCTICNHMIDWRRRNTCVDHVASLKHVNARKQKDEHGCQTQVVQQSLSVAFGSHEARKNMQVNLTSKYQPLIRHES